MLRVIAHNVTNQNLKILEQNKCKNKSTIKGVRNLSAHMFQLKMVEAYSHTRMVCVSSVAGIRVFINLMQQIVHTQTGVIKGKVSALNATGIGIVKPRVQKKMKII